MTKLFFFIMSEGGVEVWLFVSFYFKIPNLKIAKKGGDIQDTGSVKYQTKLPINMFYHYEKRRHYEEDMHPLYNRVSKKTNIDEDYQRIKSPRRDKMNDCR